MHQYRVLYTGTPKIQMPLDVHHVWKCFVIYAKCTICLPCYLRCKTISLLHCFEYNFCFVIFLPWILIKFFLSGYLTIEKSEIIRGNFLKRNLTQKRKLSLSSDIFLWFFRRDFYFFLVLVFIFSLYVGSLQTVLNRAQKRNTSKSICCPIF